MRYNRIFWLLAAALTAPSPAALARVLYVAPSGDDSNPGTSAAPLRTLQRAAVVVSPGDTVVVRNGRYGHGQAMTGGDHADFTASAVELRRSGTPDAWITFKAENKWGAVLDCEMICDSYINLLNASYIAIEDFIITRGFKEGIHSNDSAHHIRIRGNRIEYIANRTTASRFGQDGMYTNPNCYDFVIDGNVFHDIGRLNESLLDHALYLRGRNMSVVNNTFYNIHRGWAIQMADGLSNVLVENNTFAYSNLSRGGHIMLWQNQQGVTIRSNIFYDPPGRRAAPPRSAIAREDSAVVNCVIDRNLTFGSQRIIDHGAGCSLSENKLGVDPQFVDPSAPVFDFRRKELGATRLRDSSVRPKRRRAAPEV